MRTLCSLCDAALPAIRAPDSLQQAMWGGWTCPGCGERLDARGWPLAAVATGPNGVHHRFGEPPSAAVGVALTGSVFGSIGLLAVGGAGLLCVGVFFPPALCALPVGAVAFLLAMVGVAIGATLLARRGERVLVGPAHVRLGDRSWAWSEVRAIGEDGERATLRVDGGEVRLPPGSVALRGALEAARTRAGQVRNGSE